MDQPFILQIRHSIADLHCELTQCGHRQEANLQPRVLEAFEQGTEWGELCDQHETLRVQDDTVEPDNVLVFDAMHDGGLLQELNWVGLHPTETLYGHLQLQWGLMFIKC